MKSIFKLTTITFILIFFSSCTDDDNAINLISKNFTVTIENVFEAKDYFDSGTISEAGIAPGTSTSFSFNAGKGHYLQFGIMFVKSNDLFYAPNDGGIALYDTNGNATTGNITSQIKLWDAGTEVNEAPGMGSNQPMNQSGPNTGVAENGNVHMVNDGFSYPTTENVISVMIAHNGGTLFTVTINNISDASSLATPLAPGTWVIHSENQKPMFTNGNTASLGLEKLAEDGDNSAMDTNLSSKSGFFSPFAPGAYSIGTLNEIFSIGNTANAALESLAEDGDPSGFTSVFNTPNGSNSPGPLLPNNTYSFTFTANESDNLSFALMLVHSNDWFFSADTIELFPNGTALSGDITSLIKLLDAGTEADEYAGSGNNQPARQTGANVGVSENGNVTEESSLSENIPTLSDMIKVIITSN
ncbi:MAG: spondin domain-containing protein [Lutibacter sp.]|uniref:spondin domain-containing protein n=1 Tax=Lutibacter sp. TaxID=1925666 RepID=UPI0038591D6E